MEVHIEGVEKVNARLAALGPEVLRAADRGLKAAGMDIIADAKENLRANHTNATGRLSQSGRVQKAADGGSGYDVGFMSDKAYAGAVEYGRRAGRMPPPDELGEWAYKKLRIRDRKLARAAGWGLAKHIAKHGTQPHPFFKPAVDKNQPRIAAAVRDAVQQVTNRTNV
jgi:HK97 gp10 family phage protein